MVRTIRNKHNSLAVALLLLAAPIVLSQEAQSNQQSSRSLQMLVLGDSILWYEASNAELVEAVRTINAEMDQRRVVFARIDFPAPYSFSAPQTQLWGFNRSPFRMTLLFLSFGKVLSNDDLRKQRTVSCDDLYKQPRNETAEEKKNRKALRLFCRYPSLGHPNRKGALLYADSITSIMKSSGLLASIGP